MKGFTLIEILAVIVILAIVLLISIPIVGGVIDLVKKGAFESSVAMMVKSAEFDIMSGNVSYKNGRTVTYVDGKSVEDDLPYDGKRPETGVININSNGEVELALHDGTYCAVKTYSSKKVTTFKSTKEDCTITANPIFTKLSDNGNYALLLDAEGNMYYNYTSDPSVITGELAQIGTNDPVNEEKLDYHVLIAAAIISNSDYSLPDSISGIDTLIESVYFKNAAYISYEYMNLMDFFRDMSPMDGDPGLDFSTLGSVNTEIENAYLNDTKLVDFKNALQIQFKNYMSSKTDVAGVSKFIKQSYEIFAENQIGAPNIIDFCQEFLPAASYYVINNKKELIGFDMIKFYSDRIILDIESMQNNQEFLDFMMDVYYNITDEELKLPPTMTQEEREVYFMKYTLRFDGNPTNVSGLTSIINGQKFKNDIYYFWSHNENVAQSVIDDAYLNNSELNSYYNNLKPKVLAFWLSDNAPQTLAKILKNEYIIRYRHYHDMLGGTFSSFISDSKIIDIICSAYLASDNIWFARFIDSREDMGMYYKANKNNQELINYINNIKVELEKLITFEKEVSGKVDLETKLATIKEDASRYHFPRSVDFFEAETSVDEFLLSDMFKDHVYHILTRAVWENYDFADQKYDVGAGIAAMGDSSFVNYYNQFKDLVKKGTIFGNINSTTIKSRFNDVKEVYALSDNAFLLHKSGEVSVIGRYGINFFEKFKKISEVNDVKKIVAGSYFVYFIKNNGEVYAFGDLFPSIGLGLDVAAEVPTLIPTLSGVNDIYIVDSNSMFSVHNDGSVRMWGSFGLPYNKYSYADYIRIGTPTVVTNITNVNKITFKEDENNKFTSVVLHKDGTASSFDRNAYYRAGDNYSTLFLTSNHNLEIKAVEAYKYLDDSVAVTADNGDLYINGSNFNSIRGNYYSPNFGTSEFMKVVIPSFNSIYINDRFVVLIDNSNQAYYTGMVSNNEFSLKKELITPVYEGMGRNYNYHLVNYAKILDTKVKLYSYNDLGTNLRNCNGDSHLFVSESNSVLRYGYKICFARSELQ